MSTATVPAAQRAAVLPEPWFFSTLTAKYLMGLTGLGLMLFLIAHLLGNLLVFQGQDALNAYAKSLHDLGPLLWVARLGLLAIFILHIYLAFKIRQRTVAARPTRYVVERTLQTSWPSRYMLLTGMLILVFVIFHLAHYTFGWVHAIPTKKLDTGEIIMTNLLQLRDDKGRHDVYTMVVYASKQWWIVLAYVAAQVMVFLHLTHGAASWFQSFGINHPRYNPWIRRLGITLALAIALGNISMPLAIYFGLVGQDVSPLHVPLHQVPAMVR
jgi:succinate dehydrogenase / fumarate reductase cytochrome b subunit